MAAHGNTAERGDAALLDALATALAYPADAEAVRAAARAAEAAAPPAARALVARFRAFAEAAEPGELEEVYAATFDWSSRRSPHIGAHLFGDTHLRGAFLVELRARYRAHGFDEGRELPDHVAVVLRFLARCPDPALRRDLVEEGLVPALERATGEAPPPVACGGTRDAEPDLLPGGDSPYLDLLRGLLALLRPARRADLGPGTAGPRPGGTIHA